MGGSLAPLSTRGSVTPGVTSGADAVEQLFNDACTQKRPADAERLHGLANDLDASAGIKAPLVAETRGLDCAEAQRATGERSAGDAVTQAEQVYHPRLQL